ncbi:hypothetical protein [Pseudomonas sp. NPDC089401]|uniref:hypothetical protein n=1 Tax=Pseudomonas sp. NPDC089401 TaxID=3364462 RepID=UPI00381A97FE
MMEEIKSNLSAISGKGAKKKILAEAKRYDDIISSYSEIPDSCFSLWLDIFSTADLYNKPGMHIFYLNLQVCMYAVTREQKNKALKVLRSNYQNYAVIETCWHVGDLIARCYDINDAVRFFEDLFPLSTPEGREGVALGLDVIRMQKKDPDFKGVIARILSSG